MNVLSFFSGAMGLDIGLEKCGFKVRCACECNKSCAETIRANHPGVPIIEDIFQCTGKSVLATAGLERKEVFMIAGGPPCQSFSMAGKRKGMECVNGNAFSKFLQIIHEITPPYILIENVRGLLSSAKGKDLAQIILEIESIGYLLSFNLYNTANHGVPQTRERLIMVGTLKKDHGAVPYIPITHSNNKALRLKPWVTFREAVENIEDDGECVDLSRNQRFYLSYVPAGGNWRNLPEEFHADALGGANRAGGGRVGFCRRVAWDKPTPTLVTSPTQNSTMLGHPSELRPLSVAEYRRCQTFPKSYVLCGTTTAKYKQLGNAVPPLFAECVGKVIVEHARKIPVPKNAVYVEYPYSTEKTFKKRKIK